MIGNVAQLHFPNFPLVLSFEKQRVVYFILSVNKYFLKTALVQKPFSSSKINFFIKQLKKYFTTFSYL